MQKNQLNVNQLDDTKVHMKKEFHYKCPLASTCIVHKQCHVLKTAERLQSVIPAIVKCPAQKNKEIVVKIGTEATH